MNRSTALRAALAFPIFLLGMLQAWDSNVFEAGLFIVLLVSLAITLTPIAILIPIKQLYMVGTLALAFILCSWHGCSHLSHCPGFLLCLSRLR